MTSLEQGYEDFWHYEYPRQRDNEEYMAGWYDALEVAIYNGDGE